MTEEVFTSSTALLSPSVVNPGTVAVLARPTANNATTLLQSMITENEKVLSTPSTECNVNQITLRISKDKANDLLSLLDREAQLCKPAATNAAVLLRSQISNYTDDDDKVGLTRAFIYALGQAWSEINTATTADLISLEVTRAMSQALYSDVSVVPSDEMMDNVSTIYDAGTYDDTDFETENADLIDILPVIDPATAVSTTIANNPTAIADTSGISNVTDPQIDVSTAGSEVTPGAGASFIDNTEAIIDGVEDTFSEGVLRTPIKDQPLLLANFLEEDVTTEELLTPVIPSTWSGSSTAVTQDMLYLTAVTTRVSQVLTDEEKTAAREEIDLDKSVLEQDWAVETETFLSEVELKVTRFQVKSNGRVVIPIHKLHLVKHKLRGEQMFRGVLSKKRYTMVRLLNLANGAKMLWNAVKGLSFDKVQQGAGLLRIGLGIAGSVTGASSLSKASDIMGIIADGPGAIFNSVTGSTPEEVGRLSHVTSCIVPGLMRMGAAAGKGQTYSKSLIQGRAAQDAQNYEKLLSDTAGEAALLLRTGAVAQKIIPTKDRIRSKVASVKRR